MSNNKLFDNEDEELEDDNQDSTENSSDEEEDVEFVPTVSRDKIFENDYNTGNLDFEEYSMPKVDTFYAESHLSDTYDAYEYARHQKLEGLVDEYFKNTKHGKLLASKKKLPKQVLPQVFTDIREQFTDIDYTGSEIFTTIADYFGMNYEVLYDNIPSVYREELVRELDQKYNILKRKGLKRLF